MSGFNLDDYVDVNDRIAAFYEKYPDGSLQCWEWGVQTVDGLSYFYYRARAYRTADDERPGEGFAWEPIPGKTPYTKDSEAMNAETSAWGRAIAALGFEVRHGIASKQEVQSKGAGRENHGDPNRPATQKQREWVGELMQRVDFDPELLDKIRALTTKDGKLTSGGASLLIENLKDGTDEGRAALLTAVGDFEPAPTPDKGDEQAGVIEGIQF